MKPEFETEQEQSYVITLTLPHRPTLIEECQSQRIINLADTSVPNDHLVFYATFELQSEDIATRTMGDIRQYFQNRRQVYLQWRISGEDDLGIVSCLPVLAASRIQNGSLEQKEVKFWFIIAPNTIEL